jgi:hypothetical protein
VIVGHVYVVHTALARPPKDKITICICAIDNLFFWINTNPQKHGIGQITLAAKHHGALAHSCFLDCSRVTTFPEHELGTAIDRGAISADLATRIVEELEKAPPKTLPPRFLRLAINNLAPFFR